MPPPYLVSTARAVVVRLVKDWHEYPSMFNTEHDIQAELYSRLKTTFFNLGYFHIEDRRNDSDIDKKSEYSWPRISCEPHIIYNWKGKSASMRPDIILWDDLKGYDIDDDAYEKIGGGKDNWPILWACEIKYAYVGNVKVQRTNIEEIKSWFRSKSPEVAEDYNWDVAKMKTLLTYGKTGKPYHGTQWADVLNFVRILGPGDGLYWDPEYKVGNGKLWMLHAYLPEEDFPSEN